MNTVLAGLAAMALLPAMTGVPPEQAGRSITVALCSGGFMQIPIDGDAPDRAVTPCCAKGCREKRRKLIDRTQ